MNFTHSSRKSWALLHCLSIAQCPPQSARPPVSAYKVAFHLVQVTKAPANKAFKHKVCDGWHQACQNFATVPCPQAISPCEMVGALGQMKLGTAPGYVWPCLPVVPKTSGPQSTYLASRSLHQNDLGTQNPKDSETSEDHSLGKTWQRSTSCCTLSTWAYVTSYWNALSCRESPQPWKTFSVSIGLASSVATAPATKSQPQNVHWEWVRKDTKDRCSIPGPNCCIRHYLAHWPPL